MEEPTKIIENNENVKFVNFSQRMKKLGQTQYTSLLVNPHPRAHDDGTPYFEDIRIRGNVDSYYDFEIHEDDVEKFITKWIDYKKSVSPFFNQNAVVEDYL